MKVLISLYLAVVFSLCSFSQSLVGTWQANTPSIYSAYLSTYRFFPDGTFRYNTNEFDGLHRIISIGGDYKTLNYQIEFVPRYTIEIEGGSIQRDSLSTSSDTWSIIGGQIKKIPIQSPEPYLVQFFFPNSDSESACVVIDSRKYFLIDLTHNDVE